jgi:hypothetical protein
VKVVTETRTVIEFVEVTKEVPKTLTRPLNYPQGHLDGDISVNDILDLVFDLYDVVDVANADRAKTAALTQPQPSPDIPD